MSDIALNFINNSNDSNNSQVVIFQKNAAPSLVATQEIAVAWQAIPLNAPQKSHSFKVTDNFQVSVSDSFGNHTQRMTAQVGNRFDMISTPSGNKLVLNTENPATSHEVEVCNELPLGSIGVHVYKDGKLLATKTGVAPGQQADFFFTPVLHVILGQQIVEGQVMNITPLSNADTQISLAGISSADLVLTGGGSGTSAVPYKFTLENVVKNS